MRWRGRGRGDGKGEGDGEREGEGDREGRMVDGCLSLSLGSITKMTRARRVKE